MRKIIIYIVCISFCVFEVLAQNKTITGTISDERGAPVFGANVVEKGSTNGISSDYNGVFKLTLLHTPAVLEITYLGYKTESVKVDSQKSLKITLEPNSMELEDVVIVGYGTQKKASVVGAITQVKSDELKQSNVPSLANAIAGRVSGVITMMGSGKPGKDASEIFIRGQATTNSTAALVLVDGIERDWNQIDPDDIESFSVLKDASATAVYGVRGANGVILITTKRGQLGKPSFNVSVKYAMQQPIRKPDYLDSYNYALLKNEALRNDGQPDLYTAEDLEHYRTGDSPYTHPNNDYYEDFIKKASPLYQVNMNANGGTELIKYYISANVMHQEGLYREFENQRYSTNSNFDRYNVRSNLDVNVTKNLTIGIDLTGRIEIRRSPYSDGDNDNLSVFERFRRQSPNTQSYINPDGTVGGRSDESRLSPYPFLSLYGNTRRNKNVLEGAFKLNEKMDYVTPGLSFRALLGYVSTFNSKRRIICKPELWEYNRYGQYLLNRSREKYEQEVTRGPANRSVSGEAALNYSRTFNDHAVSGLILYQQSRDWNEWAVPVGYMGLVGRATYAYKQRYLFEVNAGYNGSMQFAKSNRFGLFPAVSLGWVMSEEKFFKENNLFTYLKIRGSYGEIGNDKIGNFKYLYEQQYFRAPNNLRFNWAFGENAGSAVLKQGIIEGKRGNDNVSWERAKKANIGFDSKFFNNKLSLTADFFYEKRTDILAVPYSLPFLLGMNKPQDSEREDKQGMSPLNIGQVTNKGLDMDIKYDGKLGAFNYFVKGNFTFARNRIDRIDEEGKQFEWEKREGKSLGQHFGLTDIGLYQKNDFMLDNQGELLLDRGFPTLKEGLPVPTYGVVWPGDCRYKDLDGNGFIDTHDEGPIGKSNVPEFNYGITLGGSFHGFDFNILFQGAGGAHVYYSQDAIWEFYSDSEGKAMKHHLGRYIPEDPSSWEKATYPRLHASWNLHNQQKTSRWLYSRNYLRLKNMEIGYTLPKKVLQKIRIKNIRVYLSGTNLLTFDKALNWDPETSEGVGNMYPQTRNWNVGVNINF